MLNAELYKSVLIVEDDRTLADNIFLALEAEGYAPDIAYDARTAMQRIEQEHYDALILDIGLPDVDGFHVLRHIRETLMLPLPVLLLTARNNIESKVAGFSHGADDYLTKPFSLVEVTLRIQALIRRMNPHHFSQATLQCDTLRYHIANRTVTVNTHSVKLTKKCLQILEVLLRSQGSIVSRTTLEKHLWQNEPPSSDALRSQIHLLRKSLSETGFDGIETLHGLGWKIVAKEAA